MNTKREFGPGLRALRERQGVTLEAIATATKIGRPLLDGLERNDVSRWPKGIFRRAFFRDYAAAIGAPVDDTLAEFLRLFPEYGSAPHVSESPTPFRMTFEPGRSRAWKRTMHAGAALLEAFAVTAIGLAAAWCLGVERVNAVACCRLIYYPLTSGVARTWSCAVMAERRPADTGSVAHCSSGLAAWDRAGAHTRGAVARSSTDGGAAA